MKYIKGYFNLANDMMSKAFDLNTHNEIKNQGLMGFAAGGMYLLFVLWYVLMLVVIGNVMYWIFGTVGAFLSVVGCLVGTVVVIIYYGLRSYFDSIKPEEKPHTEGRADEFVPTNESRYQRVMRNLRGY